MQKGDLSTSETGTVGDRGADSSIGSPPVSPAPKPKRGRPKDSPRIPGSGRKRGTPNKSTEVGRDYIIKRSKALPFLCDMAAGRLIEVADPENPRRKIKVAPTKEDRKFASRVLAPMVVPVMKAIEYTGDGDGLVIRIVSFADAAE